MDFKLLLRAMKLLAIIMLSVCLSATATGHGQTITLQEKKAPLQKIFREIYRQTGYQFFYQDEWLDKAGLIDIQVKDASLEQVLQHCFKNLSLNYTIKDKAILITQRSPAIASPPIDIRGRIINEAGEGVRATVTVKGTAKIVSTDDAGDFEIKEVEENATLIITAANIETKEVKVNSRTSLGEITIDIKIVEGVDVVVKTSYWETTQKKNTGNIVKITAKDIERQPVTSLMMTLQGRVPGLDIVPNNGAPGAATQLFLRGQNSVRFDGSYPLYVIDGVPIDPRPLFSTSAFFDTGIDPFVALSPDNIASIEILKDADATAIYGSRGANGVILVTTKKGAEGRKNALDINFYRGAGSVTHKLDLLDAKQLLAIRREALANVPRVPGIFDYDLNGTWDTTRHTDWQDVLLGGTSDITDVRANFSGANNNFSYKLGGGFHKEGLVFPGDFGFTGVTGHYSMNHHSSNRKFRSSFSINYGYNKAKVFNSDAVVEMALTLSPVAPALYDANGELNWQRAAGGSSSWTNPLALLRRTDETSNSSFVIGGDVSYQLLPDLIIKSNMGYTEINGQQVVKEPFSGKDPNASSFPTSTAQSSFGNNRRNSWIIEPQLNYKKVFHHHNLDIVVGSTFQHSLTQYRLTIGQGYTSDALLGTLQGAATTVISQDRDGKYRYAALFARIGYDWKGKYLVNLTGRRDGSSRFGPGKQFGNFGAVGMAWIFSEEEFIQKHLRFLSFGKIRWSAGIAGNDQIDDYKFYDTYSPNFNNYQGGLSLNPTQLYNPDYAWESTSKIEAAIELGFLKDRISASVSWYRHRSSSQLVAVPLPSMTGFTSVTDNFDALVENTGWEFLLNTINIQQKNWRWTSSINFSIPRNKLVRFDNIEQSTYRTVYKVGEPLTIRKYYTYTGIDPATGFHTVKDIDGSGTITTADQQFLEPFFRKFGGLNNTISYKRVELSFLIQFVNQNRIRADLFSTPPGFNVNNYPVFAVNHWRKSNDISEVQKLTTAAAALTSYGRYATSDAAVVDASFLRLKTLSLSWSLPASLINKAKMQQAKIFIQGQNLFTITGYEALDPESGNTLPPLRIITGGIQIKF